MEIKFQTKEESNLKQREEFLKLSGSERVTLFIELSRKINKFPTKNKVDNSKGNFILEK
jgi:hypothetical protein